LELGLDRPDLFLSKRGLCSDQLSFVPGYPLRGGQQNRAKADIEWQAGPAGPVAFDPKLTSDPRMYFTILTGTGKL
jgi:hypothetical protein